MDCCFDMTFNNKYEISFVWLIDGPFEWNKCKFYIRITAGVGVVLQGMA